MGSDVVVLTPTDPLYQPASGSLPGPLTSTGFLDIENLPYNRPTGSDTMGSKLNDGTLTTYSTVGGNQNGPQGKSSIQSLLSPEAPQKPSEFMRSAHRAESE